MSVQCILAAIDFSETTGEVVRLACDIARPSGARIRLVHVEPDEPAFVGYGPGPQSVRNDVAHAYRQDHRDLESLAQRLCAEGLDAVTLLIQGVPQEKIIEKAVEDRADLIVIGSHGHGALYDLLVGSVCHAVLKDSPCPVLVVPARGGEQPAMP